MSDNELLVLRAFENQRELNHVLHPEWTEQGWPYYRAIWRECAEVFDHVNWEWWKASSFGQPPSAEQTKEIHIELCDILHFGLSLDIVNHVKGGASTTQRAAEYVAAFDDAKTSTEPLGLAIENLMVDSLLIRDFNVKKFARACNAVGLSLEQLMAMYFGKTALNRFRWANGYSLPKDDPNRYVKMWKFNEGDTPKEDNYFLWQIIDLIVAETSSVLTKTILGGGYAQDVYDSLEAYYKARV